MVKPSLQAIAEQVGVSTATVSRALNDRAGVHPDTRAEILRIARELGYTPSVAAKSLATARTFTLGLVTYQQQPQPISSYHTHIVQGIDLEARQRGYHVITTFVDGEMMSDALRMPIFTESRVDGLILVGPALEASFIIQLYTSHVPILLVDNLLSETNIDAIVCDNVGGTYEITQHLIDVHGLHKLVFFSGPKDWFSSRERRLGYEQALAEIGESPRVIYMPDTTVNMGSKALLQALDHYPDMQGIVAVNDATAVGAIRACKENGIDVPHQLAVVGFDNVAWGPLHEPPLTTVRMFKQELGIQAARHLIDMIERGPSPGFQLRLGTELIIRESCGCPPSEEMVFPDQGS
ncbi:MAG: LacI family transcriptional regulator [Chloroflexi bacterium]|nr:LacI family transcriptional regulator [Chloroflexota bacterium]